MADFEDEFTASNDHTHQIVKRKRTKRQRTGLVVTSSSSSGGGGGGGGGGVADCCFTTPSPTTSSGFSSNSEEDEDMANCLMLLSQSSAPMQHREEKKVEKLNNRKLTAAVDTAGKGGLYVYECKTCNRTFSSFQALGGHRASHKKPKVAVPVPAAGVVEEKKSPVAQSDFGGEISNHQFDEISDCIQPISVQRDEKGIIDSNNSNKAKIHECSICGSEFSSGQALGGHMRRHRPPPATATVPEEKQRRFLSLDLNLPAPEEDCRESEFVFTPNRQQHNLVFSAPALVDCHY